MQTPQLTQFPQFHWQPSPTNSFPCLLLCPRTKISTLSPSLLRGVSCAFLTGSKRNKGWINDLSGEKPKSRPLMMLHYIHRYSVTLRGFRTYTKTHLIISSWPFRPLPSSTGMQNSLILISSLLRMRAKDEDTWGIYEKCLSNASKVVTWKDMCGLICGFRGRTKTIQGELLIGRVLIHQKELDLSHNHISPWGPLTGNLSCTESDQVTSKIFQIPRSTLMELKSLSFFAFFQ